MENKMKTKFILKSIFTVITLLVFSNISSLDIYALEKNDFYSETIDIKVAKKKRTKRKRKKRRISCNNLKSCTKYSKCRKTRKCKKIISDNEARKKEKAKKEKEEKLKKETKNNKNPKDTKKVVDGVKTSTKINPDDIKSKKNKKGVKKKRKANVVKGRRDIKGADFKSKLSIMLDYINKSISVLKQQITDNPHAPFLADLYLELGNLNAQKANTLYYIQQQSPFQNDNLF